MKGVNHVLAAFDGSLGVLELYAHPGTAPMTLPATLGFAALSAGAGGLPDIDSTKSLVAHLDGRGTQALARRIDRGSHRLYRATRTRRDPVRRDGHRGVAHTLLGALTAGALAGLCSWLGGSVAIAAVTFALAVLARRAVFGRARRRGLQRLLIPCLAALAALGIASLLLPRGVVGAVYTGSAVALGMLLHSLTDMPTDSGVPLLWPLPIRGQRWFRFRLPTRWALTTGGTVEIPIALALTLLGLGEI